MADIELVIKINEETYRNIQSHDWKNGEWWYSEEWRAIHNGTPLDKHDEEVIAETVESIWGEPVLRIPQNATNGDIIKALFPDSPRVHEIIQNNFYTWWHTDYRDFTRMVKNV